MHREWRQRSLRNRDVLVGTFDDHSCVCLEFRAGIIGHISFGISHLSFQKLRREGVFFVFR